MSVEENGEVTHPGPILRAARDELRLSVDEVAEALHLRRSVVLLIESEAYDDFSSDVFLKGYFRSYCRLVNLHEERMIELLEKQLEFIKHEKQTELREKEEEATRTKRMQLLKLGSIASAIVVLCAAFVYMSTNNGAEVAPVSSTSMDNAGTDSNLESDQQSQEVAPGLQVEGDNELDGQTAEAASNDMSVTDSLSQESLIITGSGEKPSVADLVESGEIEAPESTEEKPSNDSRAQSLGSDEALTIEFSDECWFEAYNEAGTRIGAGLKKAGDSFRYNGPLPVRVVLGNGRVATIYLNGTQFDFSASIRRSGRAEVVLEQEDE